MVSKYQFLNSASTVTTTAYIFISGNMGTSFSGDTDVIDIYQSYAKFDPNGKISEFHIYDGNTFNKRNPGNNFSILSPSSLVTGYTIVKDIKKKLSEEDKKTLADDVIDSVKNTSDLLKCGVMFEDSPEQDFYVNVSLERNTSLLETLTIKNNVLGEWNKLESQTGIVFGTLLATQKLKDIDGNPLKIPLRNVPIIIFNKEIQAISSTIDPSNDNSRIPLNMIENSVRSSYVSDFSYNFDQTILPQVTTKNVTDSYKYSTVTNEKGEFILRDVPVGIATLILEIDLLKQGLTPEEVELNVGKYPATAVLTPEQVPHLIYREVPIRVLSSWGTLNTGYTRVDINMNIDLRKWTTHFIPPSTIYGKTFDEIVQAGFVPSLNVRVRDMATTSSNGSIFTNSEDNSVECVVINDITNRDKTKLLGWFNEVRQLRSLITFNQMTFGAFKLPANIYDPDGYKTDGSGNTISDRGIWLSSYEFKVFFNNEERFYRVSGMNNGGRNGGTIIGKKEKMGGTSPGASNPFDEPSGLVKSNYDLNNTINFVSTGATIGVFPYEKPWSVNYPTRYSIPKLPISLNVNKQYNVNGNVVNEEGVKITQIGIGKPVMGGSSNPSLISPDGGPPMNMVIPKFLDGDRLGATTKFNDLVFGGWGAQENVGNDVYPNYFAQQVATSDLYKYEAALSIMDEYSNGYTPNFSYGDVPNDQKSQVKDGEQYQRLECGHAYFMWVQGFPRVINKFDYDEMYPADFLKTATLPANPPYINSYLTNNFLFNSDTLLATDFSAMEMYSKGYVYFYKIVNPDPNTLIPPQPPLIKRFIKLNFQNIYIQRGGITEKARATLGTTDKNHRFKFVFLNSEDAFDARETSILRIKNNGLITINVFIGTEEQKIPAKESKDFSLNEVANMGKLELPTNDNFDFAANTYHTTNYDLSIHNLDFYVPNGKKNKSVKDLKPNLSINDGTTTFPSITVSGNTRVDPDGIPEYFMVSRANEIRVRGPVGKSDPNSIIIDFSSTSDIQGLLLVSSNKTYVSSYEFRKNNTTPDGGKSDNLPYTVIDS